MADRKPNLCAMTGVQVVGRLRTSHPGGHPTRFKSIRQNVGPAACRRESKQHIVQFGIRVSLLSLPWTLLPRQVVQACVAALVKARAQIYEALRLLDQGSQDVGRQS